MTSPAAPVVGPNSLRNVVDWIKQGACVILQAIGYPSIVYHNCGKLEQIVADLATFKLGAVASSLPGAPDAAPSEVKIVPSSVTPDAAPMAVSSPATPTEAKRWADTNIIYVNLDIDSSLMNEDEWPWYIKDAGCVRCICELNTPNSVATLKTAGAHVYSYKLGPSKTPIVSLA